VLCIKGHRDKKTANKLLRLPAQLNVDANKLAGDYVAAHPDKDYTVVPMLPTSGIQLHLPAGTITYNIKKEVSMARTTESIKQHMIKKHDWEEKTVGCTHPVDWRSACGDKHQHTKKSELCWSMLSTS